MQLDKPSISWWLHLVKLLCLFLGIILMLTTPSADAKISLPWGPFIIPRSGRSAPMEPPPYSWKQHPVPDCCPAGRKTGWIVSQDDSLSAYHFCPREFKCCTGLRETKRLGQDGFMYIVCLPPYSRIPAAREDRPLSMGRLYSTRKR